MEKIKNALKSVNKFGLLALALVAFATLAFKAPTKNTDVLYGKNSDGSWTVINSGTNYLCDPTSEVCTRLYPAGKTPTANPNDFIEENPGTFIPL